MGIIAPSFLAANFLDLKKEAEMLNESEAEWFHLDIMDGSFVPNISFGIPIVEHLRLVSDKVFDVHLMINDPGKYAESFVKAGANNITVHIENCPHLHRNIQQIKGLGAKAGVAINPHTPTEALFEILPEVDLVCVMSVNPGFGGQKFIENSLKKIEKLSSYKLSNNLLFDIEVDGGVTLDNAKSIIDAGATVLVAGNTVFKAKNPKEVIGRLKALF